MSSKLAKRGRLNALKRCREADDPDVVDATRDLAAESLAEHIADVVNSAPPLSSDQIERLRGLLPAPSERGGVQ